MPQAWESYKSWQNTLFFTDLSGGRYHSATELLFRFESIKKHCDFEGRIDGACIFTRVWHAWGIAMAVPARRRLGTSAGRDHWSNLGRFTGRTSCGSLVEPLVGHWSNLGPVRHLIRKVLPAPPGPEQKRSPKENAPYIYIERERERERDPVCVYTIYA